MKYYDFVFVYEVKARELENICLLKTELERRGYSVALVNTWEHLGKPPAVRSAHVLVSFALYNDAVLGFVSSYIGKYKKILNMQWEQVLPIGSEGILNVSDAAKNAVHIVWGEKERQRLLRDCELPEKNVKLTGHLSLDFLRPQFAGYYMDRNALFAQYGIDPTKKACLFVSSFSSVNLPETILDVGVSLVGDIATQLVDMSTKSFMEIMRWIEEALRQNPDTVMIFRPHPAQAEHEALQWLERKYGNFFVTCDYSIKQWLLCCDLIYTWCSTSAAEIYVSGKPLYVVRPLPIPAAQDYEIYQNAKILASREEFVDSLSLNAPAEFPLDLSILQSYYDFDSEVPAYMKICNVMEEMYLDDFYLFPNRCKPRAPFSVRVKLRLKPTFVYRMACFLANRTRIKLPLFKRMRKKTSNTEEDAYMERMKANNYAAPEEIIQIQEKLRQLI